LKNRPEFTRLWRNGSHQIHVGVSRSRCADLNSNKTSCSVITTLDQRIPIDHALRPLRVLVDMSLVSMDREFDGLYATPGRSSTAPERLLRASLLQVI